MGLKYGLIRSKRKTISLEIGKNGEPLVRAPLFVAREDIEAFVARHEDWICRHRARWLERKQNEPDEQELQTLYERARKEIPPLVERYSRLMGLYPERVTITGARTRFGSCSGKNRICFSCYLMAYPREAVEYVVVHELAHIRFHNHQREFYHLIARYLPDYRERIKLLRR